MEKWCKIVLPCLIAFVISIGHCQDTEKEELERQLCEDKGAGEWFRLEAGKDKCRDVIQCTSSGLQAIRCPAGLAFDIEKQTCDWKNSVDNCEKKKQGEEGQASFIYDEPICQENFLACGDGNCIERGLFCNGERDCNDGSDENACDIETDPNRAPPYGTHVPGELCEVGPAGSACQDIPQMVTVTFDDAINNNNIDLYTEIFDKKRKNPNGLQEMHAAGHEIAAHSITHNEDEDFWTDATTDDWAKEMAGSRLIIDKFANISDNSVVGLRAPYLRVGGNNQFTMMEEQAFLYDSSITAPLQNPPLWPYTMYFRMPHRCHGDLQNCPTRSHAVWEMVMNELDRREDPTVDEDLAGCAMVDSCSNILSGDQFYNFLTHNFYRHYDQNRAPLGLFFHAAWLKNNPDYLDAFLYWVDEVLESHKDVYFVTMTQVIQWIQEPKKSSEALNFDSWKEKCDVEYIPSCVSPNRCKLSTKELPGEAVHLHTCVRCPNNYPWLNDPTGDGFF
ncbi:unnamed protein product [Lepeophtheirus salmonis]|uniref:(salmon louse) hypothetical protein n=1 Tax=Lepeophtheirus salmonis TaxID=72036 RepID=A0A7R8H6I4_LEPSM|nr:unnamed protein product [Lepeophtheirus salmonis]CAF2883679.1 unnamed protein product [Lepeophtheirus salmonis]